MYIIFIKTISGKNNFADVLTKLKSDIPTKQHTLTKLNGLNNTFCYDPF